MLTLSVVANIRLWSHPNVHLDWFLKDFNTLQVWLFMMVQWKINVAEYTNWINIFLWPMERTDIHRFFQCCCGVIIQYCNRSTHKCIVYWYIRIQPHCTTDIAYGEWERSWCDFCTFANDSDVATVQIDYLSLNVTRPVSAPTALEPDTNVWVNSFQLNSGDANQIITTHLDTKDSE